MLNRKLPINIDIPEDFLQEEVRSGYVVSTTYKKIWAVELDLLHEFQRVCDKYNLRWYADGGTLLGAVRHHGMIPWDDDIDIVMMRSEYDKLCCIAMNEFKYPYFFQTNDTEPSSMRGHAQLRNSMTTAILLSEKNLRMPYNQGIFIDIFPLDNIPREENMLKELTANIEEYKKQAMTYYIWKEAKPNSLYKRLKYRTKFLLAYFGVIGKYRNYRDSAEKFDKEIIRYNPDESCDLVSNLSLPPFSTCRIWKKVWFEDYIDMPFEWFKIPVPIGYLELLQTKYGRWEEYVIGTSTHGCILFDTDNSYKKYIHKKLCRRS